MLITTSVHVVVKTIDVCGNLFGLSGNLESNSKGGIKYCVNTVLYYFIEMELNNYTRCIFFFVCEIEKEGERAKSVAKY